MLSTVFKHPFVVCFFPFYLYTEMERALQLTAQTSSTHTHTCSLRHTRTYFDSSMKYNHFSSESLCAPNTWTIWLWISKVFVVVASIGYLLSLVFKLEYSIFVWVLYWLRHVYSNQDKSVLFHDSTIKKTNEKPLFAGQFSMNANENLHRLSLTSKTKILQRTRSTHIKRIYHFVANYRLLAWHFFLPMFEYKINLLRFMWTLYCFIWLYNTVPWLHLRFLFRSQRFCFERSPF